MFVSGAFDALHHLGDEWIGDGGDNHTYGLGASHHQTACPGIGGITHLTCQALNARFGFGIDQRAVAQRARDSRVGNAGRPGNIFDRNPVSYHENVCRYYVIANVC